MSSIRLRNLLSLHQAFAQARVTNGESLAGLESAFAASLEVSLSMWSQIKSGRTVGDKLARQFESKSSKPLGWLDQEHSETAPDPAEEKFIATCRAAWASADRTGRAELKKIIGAAAKRNT
ncbi:MAG: hypothetical protein KBD82_05605 [Rhodoferax sp.]|jgi:hypothetical protein|nr:hypothetical protein [Rhodoferax sp.]